MGYLALATYDLGIIGGGPAGYVAAIRAAQLGGRVLLVERESIGGTCLNRGCIPTKTLLESGQLFRQVAKAAEFGIALPGTASVDFPAVMARKQAVVQRLVQSVTDLLLAHRVEIVSGEASLLSPQRLLVRSNDGATLEIQCRNVLLATGSDCADPALPGCDGEGVLDSRAVLSLQRLPESMVVIGASVVGMELASIFNLLGTRVTVLGRRSFLQAVDQQLARRARALFARRGMKIETGLELRGIERLENGMMRVGYTMAGREHFADGSVVLIATGRRPLTDGLGLAEAGIATERGFVRTDRFMRTSVPGVFAAGDVTGGAMLAHVAAHEGAAAAENALGGARALDYSLVPNCVFTYPEIASVGLDEASAKAQGADIAVSRFPFSANGRALTMGEEEGLVRMVYEKGSGRILGVHIMGPHASELIAEGQVAIRSGLTVSDLAELMHQHPTLSEAIMEAAQAATFGEAIHYRHV